METFQENLKNLRKSHNLTQLQLAQLINKSRSTVSLYEIGKRTPGLQTITKLCSIFHVSFDELLGTDGLDNLSD